VVLYIHLGDFVICSQLCFSRGLGLKMLIYICNGVGFVFKNSSISCNLKVVFHELKIVFKFNF
jgi:hypothetical protein